MNKSVYKQVTLLAALMLLGTATVSSQEITKDFTKTFSVDPTVQVALSNRYGDVNIETWNKSEVSIDVKITVEMTSAERAERLINLIDIEFFENNSEVGAKTVLDDRFSSVTRGIVNSRFRIDYTVRMPGENSLNVANRYGNIKMGSHPGLVNIDLRYGNLIAMKLTRGNENPINTISLSYGKASIDEANWVSITARYTTDLTIRQLQAMMLDSRYSKVFIGTAGSIVAESKYDNISVDEINNLVAESGYTSYKIGSLNNKLNLNTKYGSFNADHVPAGFENIMVDAAYCGIGIGIDRNASYKINAKVNYGSLSYCDECIDIQRRIVENNSREISGIAGSNPSPSSTVDIKSSYGSVRLK